MTFKLEDVIKGYKDVYESKISSKKEDIGIGFLKRQIEKNDYDLNLKVHYLLRNKPRDWFPYLDLYVDELLIFYCLIKEKKVKKELYEEGIIPEKNDDLKLLTSYGG